jgi:hypothetical protein
MGLSDWSANEISSETFLDDLETVVDFLGLTRFALLGMHSGAREFYWLIPDALSRKRWLVP